MADWLHNLPIFWMALLVFGLTYLLAAGICGLVTGLAKGERARAFKAFPPECSRHWALSSAFLSRSLRRRSGTTTNGPIRRSIVKRARSEPSWSLPLLFRANRNRACAPSSAATLSKPQLRNGR